MCFFCWSIWFIHNLNKGNESVEPIVRLSIAYILPIFFFIQLLILSYSFRFDFHICSVSVLNARLPAADSDSVTKQVISIGVLLRFYEHFSISFTSSHWSNDLLLFKSIHNSSCFIISPTKFCL